MKKSSILLLGLLVVAIVVVATMVARYLPDVVPYWQCSEVYKKYSRVEGVRATYVKDYRVNDTLTVGVTLLEATVDSGWVTLQEDFGLPVIPKEYEKFFCADSNKVSLKFFPKKEPLCLDGDTLLNDVLAISFYKHTIAYFEVKNRMQSDLFICKQFGENEKNDSYNYSNYEENN